MQSKVNLAHGLLLVDCPYRILQLLRVFQRLRAGVCVGHFQRGGVVKGRLLSEGQVVRREERISLGVLLLLLLLLLIDWVGGERETTGLQETERGARRGEGKYILI